MDRGHVSLHIVNMMWADLNPLALILHFFKTVLDCSFCEVMAGFVARTAVSLAKVAVEDSGEVGRYHLNITEMMEAESQAVLNTLTENDFQDKFKKWQKHCKRCFESDGVQ
jgi:hypothetical protein